MEEFDLSIEVAFVVRQRKPRRKRPRAVRYFNVVNLSLEQYTEVHSMLQGALSNVAADLLRQGYGMEYQGKRLMVEPEQ